MTIWLDAQLSPRLASWIAERFGCSVHHVRELGLRDSTDAVIFRAAREANALVLTKDSEPVE